MADDAPTVDREAIRRRWSTDGGMGNDRSADDYTDAGCRVFAEHGFRDVPALLAEVSSQAATLDRVRGLARPGRALIPVGELLATLDQL